jgi:hypothetical protein
LNKTDITQVEVTAVVRKQHLNKVQSLILMQNQRQTEYHLLKVKALVILVKLYKKLKSKK